MKVAGWFEKDGQLIMIRQEEGQSPDEAIQEEAKDHGVDPNQVKRGAPPGYSEMGEKIKDSKESGNPGPSEEPPAQKKTEPPPSENKKPQTESPKQPKPSKPSNSGPPGKPSPMTPTPKVATTAWDSVASGLINGIK